MILGRLRYVMAWSPGLRFALYRQTPAGFRLVGRRRSSEACELLARRDAGRLPFAIEHATVMQ